MNVAISAAEPAPDGATRLSSRGDLTAFMMEQCRQLGADGYMLLAVMRDPKGSELRIVASNWIYDAIQMISRRALTSLVQCLACAAPGQRPTPIVTRRAPALPGIITGEEARLLDVLGHGEIYPLSLHVGRQRLFMLFSTAEPDRLDPAELSRAQIQCCYALSQVPGLLAATAQQDPLSDRERECLFWVSEGKTTDEVALILGVSANTVNSYVTNAVQKFSARNRTSAVAAAIRNGIL
jgi:DNA-binding CsgD family transcriptional regulator